MSEDAEITHDEARDESRCGLFCDEEPDVSFEAFGYTFHRCQSCYEEPCSRCGEEIEDDSNKPKGWCQSCREEIRLICGGDEERGIEKDEDNEQTTLLTDGGRAEYDRELPRGARENLTRALSTHEHNVARFNVVMVDDAFTMEFTENEAGERYWNISGHPPRKPPDQYEVVNSSKVFALVESDAESVDDACEELRELLDAIGGEDAHVDSMTTFHSPTVPEWARDTTGWLKSKFSEVFGHGN